MCDCADLKDYRCPGNDCRDRALCHRFRTGKGETAPMTAMYVRREAGQNRCDQFIDAQLASEIDEAGGAQ